MMIGLLAGDAAITGHVVFAAEGQEGTVGFQAGRALGAAVPAASAARQRRLTGKRRPSAFLA
jgi:hypothetical protein